MYNWNLFWREGGEMEWENAVYHDISYSDFNYPTEGQVISAQMGLFPHPLKWLNPNLSDGPVIRCFTGWNVARNYQHV